MKKYFYLLFLPLLLSTHCDDDHPLFNDNSDIVTKYIIKNNSSVDLMYIDGDSIKLLKSNTSNVIHSTSNKDVAITPSISENFNEIKLYVIDNSDHYLLTYQQNPIDDALWFYNVVNEDKDILYEYTLTITNDDLK